MPSKSSSSTREVRLGELFVKLADTLVAGFDLNDLLQTLADETTALLPVDGAAVFLADGDGVLHVAAATSAHDRAVEVLILESNASPCLAAYQTGRAAGLDDIDAADSAPDDWEYFARILRAAGYRASHAVPMRLRSRTIGALSLFSEKPYTPSAVDADVAQTLADAATIAIIQMQNASESAALSEQLQRALDSRVVIEQAKGVIAQTHGVSMTEAFSIIRGHARQHNESLKDVSSKIVQRTLTL